VSEGARERGSEGEGEGEGEGQGTDESVEVQALEPLNEHQKMLNAERQALYHAFMHSGKRTTFGDDTQRLVPAPAMLSWRAVAGPPKEVSAAPAAVTKPVTKPAIKAKAAHERAAPSKVAEPASLRLPREKGREEEERRGVTDGRTEGRGNGGMEDRQSERDGKTE